jgi:pimeloyl-ACP methyl ester carboxylesterase
MLGCLLWLTLTFHGSVIGQFIPAGGLKVHYTVSGKGDVLLLLHGGYQDLHMWDPQTAYFSKFYKVVLIDLPCHGQTTGLDTNLLVADVVRIVIDSLHIRKVVVGGLSLGGACAVDFALDYPDRVNGLIAVSPGLSGWPLVMKMDTLSRQLFNRMDSIRHTGDHAQFAAGFVATWCVGPYRQPSEVDEHVRSYIYTTTLANRMPDNGWPNFDTSYAAPRLKNIKCPVLIIRGDKDLPFIIRETDYYKQQIPKATLITMTNVAHMVNMEKPEEFNRVVRKWLINGK